MKVGGLRGCWTGDAWLSSVRGLNCSLQWGNERNPCCLLQESGETAPSRGRKVGMTPSQHVPLTSWAARALQSPLQRGAKAKAGANPKKRRQFGLRSATRPHEAGIASNRGSAHHGEYVLEPCTHRPSTQGSREDRKISSIEVQGKLGNRE